MIHISRLTLGVAEEEALLRVVRSGQIAMGPETQQLEEEFSYRFGGANCIAVMNGTVGIMLALVAMGVGPGDEVITTAFSFIGTIEPIIHLGARPVFADVDIKTANIQTESIESLISDKTKAILPVHLYGRPASLKTLREITRSYGIPILEDACQAIGATDTSTGQIGSSGTSVFSFYGSKNIACGEGGLIATDDSDLADRIRLLRNHGSTALYNHTLVGYNARMTDLQAAILRVQLRNVDAVTRGRQSNAEFYDDSISNYAIALPPKNDGEKLSCFHQYTVKLRSQEERDNLQDWATQHEVETRAYYPYSLSSHPVVKMLGYEASCKNADELSRTVLSIPVRETLSDEDRSKIASVLNAWSFPG